MSAEEYRELSGLCSLIRLHIEVRNRSWMKRIHHSCFIGSSAVDFIVQSGLADSRKQAVALGQKMLDKKLFRHVNDSSGFRDAYMYYRFADDEDTAEMIGRARLATSMAGNGHGTYIGEGGCKFSFSPHTAHNSYIMDIALAQEIERAVAGASLDIRMQAICKLRARVKEEAGSDAPDWQLSESTDVNGHLFSVFQRQRPRGAFKNVKMNGYVQDNPKDFIKGLLDFSRRSQWEGTFDDGVVVEEIDIGEGISPFFNEADNDEDAAFDPEKDPLGGLSTSPKTAGFSLSPKVKSGKALSPRAADQLQRSGTEDVSFFLDTVEDAGVPANTPIAYLNDPERQTALAHLRKMMMLSNPQECMLCSNDFGSQSEIRFCPCCAMVSCSLCVARRVFEVASRQMVSVCVHCFRESSRIRHPPAPNSGLANNAGWWRKEDTDASKFLAAAELDKSVLVDPSSGSGGTKEADSDDDEILDRSHCLIPGLLDDEDPMSRLQRPELTRRSTFMGEQLNEQGEESVIENFEEQFVPVDATSPTAASTGASSATVPKTARCKHCGLLISREVEEIEMHMSTCVAVSSKTSSQITASSPRVLGGIPRKDKNRSGTRIIYRIARTQSKLFKPREVCSLQDSFIDVTTGTCYVYEVSVRHCDVRGISDCITAEVLLLLYAASPMKGSKTKGSSICVVSQVDSRANGSAWLVGGGDIGAPAKEDLLRELKAAGSLRNILDDEESTDATADGTVSSRSICLDDFEFLCVLGRGGFGKVMQVRNKRSQQIYAMKILKKSELQRRRQVERTQTEMKILAAVKHPFVVQMHYAFQNESKLFMVMDFVQGGDFFTLMRKFRRLPEDWCRVYIAEISMALQHLHEMEIVYRDLKPENILLCANGHLKLTDFGLSRFFETRPPAPEDMIGEGTKISRSFCGTEQYMAPEMLLQQGHTFRMDWWSLGLLIHEMMSSKHPFHGPTHYDTLRNMVTKQPNIDTRISAEAADVIRQLLINNPKTRLCSKRGISEMKELPYFVGTDWDGLYRLEVPMPFSPNVTSSTDVSSFETLFTNEAPVDSVSEQYKAKSKAEGRSFFSMLGFGFSKKKGDGKDSNKAEEDSFAGFAYTREDIEQGESSTLAGAAQLDADTGSRV